ncbi:MAG: hypothetical protein HY720_15800 [Planctomycetes bacterium]|nr:hypothetical protein [Planctomycetota bacterium]
MRLHPERSLARLAVLLGKTDVAGARRALAHFRRERRITAHEFGASLVAAGAMPREALEELLAVGTACRAICEGCRKALRVWAIDLEVRLRCPGCRGRLHPATDQRTAELAPGAGPMAGPLLRAPRLEPARVERGRRFEDLEREAEREARRHLAIVETVRFGRGVESGDERHGVMYFRPSWAWRHPRAAILSAGGAGCVPLFAGLVYSLGQDGIGVPAGAWAAGLAAVAVSAALVARSERAQDRGEDQLFAGREIGLVQIARGWIRSFDPGERLEVRDAGKRAFRIVAPSRAAAIEVDSAHGYSRPERVVEALRRKGFLS